MGGLPCRKAAIDAQALTGTDGCRNYMERVEFLMNSSDFAEADPQKQEAFVDAVEKLERQLERQCREFCESMDKAFGIL